MKLKIWNPYGLGISHMKFERNRSRKFFWRPTNLGAEIFLVSIFQKIQKQMEKLTSPSWNLGLR